MLIRSKKSKLVFLLAFVIAIACSEDEPSVASEPTFSIESIITGLPGETFRIKGLISDAAGVESVTLRNDSWSLNKTIVVDEGITQYPLNYSFKVPDEAEFGSTHIISVSALNPGGKVSETMVEVVLSKDNEEPVISFASPNDGGTYIIGAGDEFDLTFNVTDNVLVQRVEIVGLGFNENVTVENTAFSFNQGVDFSIAGPFSVVVTATDNSGNLATTTLNVAIEESLKFDKMYLADVGLDADLISDVFGVPMRIDGFTQVDSAGVVFRARYYNKEADTEIRFIPQKSSFAPFAFGQGENAGELAIGNDATVDPIILPSVGYYEIYLNLGTQTFMMETFEPQDTPFDQIYLMGTGVSVNGASTCVNNNDASESCWDFASGKPLTVDSNNPYLFTATLELFDHDLEGDGNNGFILGANPAGWSPFWRFDVGDEIGLEPESTVPNGGGNYLFGPGQYGTYTFEFDTYLNRVKLTTP